MTLESIAVIGGAGVMLVSVVLYVRSQRGTEGPSLGRVPRLLRPVTNAWFALMDWPIPFDRHGELIAVADRRRARER